MEERKHGSPFLMTRSYCHPSLLTDGLRLADTQPPTQAAPVYQEKTRFFVLRAHVSGAAGHAGTPENGALAFVYVQKLKANFRSIFFLIFKMLFILRVRAHTWVGAERQREINSSRLPTEHPSQDPKITARVEAKS